MVVLFRLSSSCFLSEAGLSPEGLGILISVSRGISKAADQKEAADNFVKEIRESKQRVM